MTTIVPPPPSTPPLPASSSGQPVALVTSPPAELMKLPPGTLISATLSGQITSPSGQTIGYQVSTPFGTLSLQTGIVLPQNAVLSLVLGAQGQLPQVRITSVNGAPFTPAQTNAPPPTTGQASRLNVGDTLHATLIRPTTPTPGVQSPAQPSTQTAPIPSQGAPTQPAAGTSGTPPANIAASNQAQGTANPQSPAQGKVRGQVQGQTQGQAQNTLQGQTQVANARPNVPIPTPPQGGATTTQGAGTGSPPSGTPTPSGAPTVNAPAGTPAGNTTQLPVGSKIAVRITGINPPGTASTPASNTSQVFAQGNTISGTISGTTPSGQLMVRTPAGVISLPNHAPLSTGTQVRLEVIAPPLPARAETLQVRLPQILQNDSFALGRTWPNLTQAMEVLHAAAPAAHSAADHIMPQVNARMGATMLFFLSALRGGNLANWIGETPLQALSRANPSLMNALKDEFKFLSQNTSETLPNDWRMTAIPLMHQGRVEQIRLLMRRNREKNKRKDEKDATRFVLDFELSQMGRMQLDGLLWENEKRLDLIVRSQLPLADDMQREILRIYSNVGELIGLRGGLAFQPSPDDFVEIEITDTRQTGPGLIV